MTKLIKISHRLIRLKEQKKKKQRYKTYKPYWNDELENLWRAMHKYEKDYTRFLGRRENRDSLRIKFLVSRNKFERSFNKSLCMEIEDNYK